MRVFWILTPTSNRGIVGLFAAWLTCFNAKTASVWLSIVRPGAIIKTVAPLLWEALADAQERLEL